MAMTCRSRDVCRGLQYSFHSVICSSGSCFLELVYLVQTSGSASVSRMFARACCNRTAVLAICASAAGMEFLHMRITRPYNAQQRLLNT